FYVNKKLSSGSIGRSPLTSTPRSSGQGRDGGLISSSGACAALSRPPTAQAEPLREAALEVLGLEVRRAHALVPCCGSVLVHHDRTRHLPPPVSPADIDEGEICRRAPRSRRAGGAKLAERAVLKLAHALGADAQP